MASSVRNKIRVTFHKTQFNKTCHQKQMKKLKEYYETIDKERFGEFFVSSLAIPLTKGEKHPHVENVLEFAAKFAVSLYSFTGDETDEQMCPFLTKLFDFLLSHHDAKDSAVRFRVCYFMNMLLNSMGEDAFIDDALCDRISAKMTERMLDKSPKVRAQAVFSLHRLQDPTDEQCPIIKLFVFHLCKDPQAEVRRAVLTNIGKNKKTLQAVLKRTRDVNDTVRKLAYQFISKITVRSLTIEQREQLLSDGLKDRSEMVNRCVKTVLLPSWLQHFNGDFISLLRALDAENAMETVVSALETMFKATELKNILDQVPVDSETKLIPLEKLSSENVLYWRCTVEHLYREGCGDDSDQILPELSKFCTYIRDFIAMMGSKQYQAWEELMHKFVLLQLFEITKTYDLSDEIGRVNLKQLILEVLLTEHCSEKVVDCIVKHMEVVVEDIDARLNLLVEVINELRMPMQIEIDPQISEQERHEKDMKRARLRVDLMEVTEEQYQAIQEKDYLKAESLKERIESLNREITELSESNDLVVTEVQEENMKNDKETMFKCLGIMCAIMQVKSVKTLTPTLRSILQNMVLPSLAHPNDDVHIQTLRALGICCILDKELAKQHIMMFFLEFVENQNQQIWLTALKAIFDLLLLHGFEHFEIVQNDEDDTAHNKSKRNRTVRLFNQTEDRDLIQSTQSIIEDGNGNIIKILTGLLDNANQELRTIATEGLCKLLLHKRISSAGLLSRLIILWHSPVTEVDTYLRQCLCGFFSHFVVSVPESQEMLEEAFMPTLKTLAHAPDISPLARIEPTRVAKLILSLSKPGIQQPNAQTYCPHNNLAFAIMAEALNIDSEIDQEVLIKSLKYLEVSLEDNIIRQNLQDAAEELFNMLEKGDKRLIKLVTDFKDRLSMPDESQGLG